MIDSLFATKSDSFYFVGDTLVMHNKGGISIGKGEESVGGERRGNVDDTWYVYLIRRRRRHRADSRRCVARIESLLYALPPVQGCMTGRRMALAMMSRHMSEQHMYLRLLFW